MPHTMGNPHNTAPTTDAVKLVLPVRQAVMMPAAHNPLTQMQVRADTPPKSKGAHRPVRRFHTLPLAPSWAEVPVTPALVEQWCDIQRLLKHHQWTEVRRRHAITLGYSPEQWRLLTDTASAPDTPQSAPHSRAEPFRGDPTVFVPAITEIAVLADSLAVVASDHRTGVTVESLGFDGDHLLSLLNDHPSGETLIHPAWPKDDALAVYHDQYACPSSGQGKAQGQIITPPFSPQK